ncbi:hypothetical protein, partial [Escherichia coli]|uniref:hypothetical protein n=1 Tax=Escherichia coli TaxID=562 RepID=UPI003D08D23B
PKHPAGIRDRQTSPSYASSHSWSVQEFLGTDVFTTRCLLCQLMYRPADVCSSYMDTLKEQTDELITIEVWASG